MTPIASELHLGNIGPLLESRPIDIDRPGGEQRLLAGAAPRRLRRLVGRNPVGRPAGGADHMTATGTSVAHLTSLSFVMFSRSSMNFS